MKWSELEKRYRTRLRQERVPVDVDELWGAIEPALREKKKRRRGLLFWWLGAALLALGFALGWNWNPAPIPSSDIEEKAGSVAELPTQYAPDSSAHKAVAPKSTVPTFSDKKESGIGIGSSRIVSPQKWKKYSKLPMATSFPVESGRIDPEYTPKKGGWEPFPTLPVHSPSLEPEETSLRKVLLTPKGHSPWELSLDIGLGLGSGQVRYAAADAESAAYAQFWERHEQPIQNLQWQTLIKVQHRSGGYLRSGLMLHQFTERLEFDRDWVVLDTLNGVVSAIHYQQGGDTVAISGALRVKNSQQYRTRWHTVHRSLNIPILVGWQWRQPWGALALEGGVVANVNWYSKGAYPSLDGPIVRFDAASTDNPYRRSVGWGYYGGLRFSRPLNNRVSWYVNPYWRYIPTPVSRADAAVRKELQLFGLTSGISIHL